MTVSVFALLLVVICIAFVVRSGQAWFRFTGVIAACGLSTFLGAEFEKILYLNRHIDMCSNETLGFHQDNNGFDPSCEILRRD